MRQHAAALVVVLDLRRDFEAGALKRQIETAHARE
jgi:hypothetical protein